MKYRFIEDPGHGWLEVQMSELIALGITQKISSCSYTTGPRPGGADPLVYLEEDCDFAVFAKAKGWIKGDSLLIKSGVEYWETVYQDPTFVRNLYPFHGITSD